MIAFEEAKDGIAAISQQAQWFQQALHSILDFYDFETYNLSVIRMVVWFLLNI